METSARKMGTLNPGRIIPAANVRIVEAPPEEIAAEEPAPIANADAGAHLHEPEIVLLREGDRVKTIVIKCLCGQVISLDCEY